MEFAAPVALALALLAVPAAALFLVKPRPKVYRIATLMFWERSVPSVRRQVALGRLRNPVALLAVLVTLGLIVLAAAGPYSVTRVDAGRRVILVVDNSHGMRATDTAPTRLDRAKTIARRTVAAMRPGQVAAVVTAGGSPAVRCGPTDDPGQLVRAVDAVPVTDAPRQTAAAVAAARRLADGGRVVVISGGAERPAGDDIDWVPVGTRIGNTAVTAFRARRLGGGADFELLVEVTHAADAPAATRLEVTLDGDLLDAIPLALEPGQVWQKVLPKVAAGGGRLRAKLSPPDRFPDDDGAWAVLPPTDLLPVAFAPLADTPGDDAVRSALEELPFVRKPVAVAADGADPIRAGAVAVFHRQLPKELPTGPVLVIDPPGGTALWDLSDPVGDPDARVKDPTSPLVARLTFPRDAVGKPRGVRPKADARVIVEAASGEPVLIDFPRPGAGRVIVLAADLEGGGLRYSPTFVALLGNILQHLVGVKADLPEPYAAGDRVALEVPTVGRFELRAPDAAPVPLAEGPVSIGPLDRRGVWAVGPSGSGTEIWSGAAAPLGAADTDLRPAPADGYSDPAPFLPPRVWLGLAAIAVLAAEWIAYHRRWIE